MWTSTVQANPAGEQVVAGAAGFERVGGALTITQGTDRAVINWNSFSIGAGEITKFVQPNSSSAVLNRVITANNPSAIYGTLQANGQVYLINPAGIFIGPGGLVDTAGFVASTHDVGDKEFMAGGDLNFTGSSGASIVNQGRIEAKQGDVFLVARQVSNEGQIMASDGTVGMVSGTEVCLHSIGPNNYKVRLIDVADDAGVKKTDNGIADVVNAGVIEAANAELESTGNYLSLAIKNTGVIRATGVMANADGSVTLTGGEGDILNTGVVAALQKNTKGENIGGTIVASAKNITTDPGSIMTAAGSEKGGEIRLAAKDTVYASGKVEAGSTAGKGGKVQVTGERIALIQAEVDVSGKTGGGTVLVGGDYLGKNPEVPNAKAVVMTSDSVIRANATENGDGGKVILWSDEYTGFYGEIFARGGIESGNGGFVETSSKDNLQAFGNVGASAPNGNGGLWLLDPTNVEITAATNFNPAVYVNPWVPTGASSQVSAASIASDLNAGTSVTIQTSGANGQTGNITMTAGISKDATVAGTASTLTMIAAGSINISQAIGSVDGDLSLVLGAQSGVTIGANITTRGGNLTIQGATADGASLALSTTTVTISSLAAITTLGGDVTLDAALGSITLGNNSITTLGGSVTMSGGLGITQGTGTITTAGGDLFYRGSLNLTGATATIDTSGGDILFNAAVNGLADGAQALTITAGTGDIRFGGDVGSSTTRLGAITINTAADVVFVGTVTASSLAQGLVTSGTGTTTFSGTQNYNSVAGLQVVTDTIVLNSSVTTSSSGVVSLIAINNVAAGPGTLTIGSSGDISAAGVVNLTGANGISTAGDVVTSADLISFNSPTTLTGNIKVDTTDSAAIIPSPGGANMIFQSTLDGAFTPTLTAGTTGNIIFKGVIGGINSLDSLVMTAAAATLSGVTTLNNQTYTTPINLLDPAAASFVSTSGNITLSNGLESLSTTQDLTISANGTVTFGSSLGSLSPFRSVTVTAGTSITTQSITTQGGGITLTGPVILSVSSIYDTTGSGAVTAGGNITLTSTLSGTLFDLGLTAGTGGEITGTSVNINNLTLTSGASAAFTGAMTVNDLITTINSGTVSLTGTGNTFTQNVDFLNTGGVTLGNATGDTFLFNGGLTFTGNAPVSLAAAISSSGDVINFGTGGVTLTASSTVDTTNSAGTPAGAAITFGSTLGGAQTLGLTAGTAGNVVFTGVVGGTIRLGAITISSANDVTAAAITAASLTQTIGQGTTTFFGAQNYNTATGLNVVTDTITLNQAVATANGGIVTLNANNAGVGVGTGALTIAAAGDITSDGAVSLTGANGIITAGDVTTTGDVVNYNSLTGLTGSVQVDTTNAGGVATGGTITFASTLDGTEDLGLTAGTTGDVVFGGVVGANTRLLAIMINSANDVTAIDISAASLVQTTGQGTTTFNGSQNYNAAAGLNVVTDTITLNQAVATANGGIVTLNANNAGVGVGTGALTIAAAGDITSDGAVNLTGANGISTAGNVTTTAGDVVNYNSATTLTGSVQVDTTNAGGVATGANITFGAGITGGALNLGLTAGSTGAITGTTVDINDLTLTSGASAAFTGAMTVNDLITTINSGTVSLTGTGNTFTQNVDFLNTGGVTLGNATGDTFLFNGGLRFTGSSPVSLAAAISSSGDVINFGTGGVTLLASSTVDTTNAGGVATGSNITFFAGITDGAGAFNLGLTAGSVGEITGTSVNINDLTLTSVVSAAFTGAVTVNNLITTANNYTVSLTGTGNTFTQNVDFLNTGAVTLGDVTGDTFLFNGGLTFTGNAPVFLAAAISSPGVLIDFGTGGVTLVANSTVDTTVGSATGAAITFSSELNGTVSGSQTLGLTAGAGNITLTGAVGGTTQLGAVTVNSAENITAINSGNRFSGPVTVGSSQNTALYLNRLDDANLGPVFANQNFTLFSNGDLTLNPLNDTPGVGQLSNTQLSGFSVGRLILNTGSILIPVAFNYPNIQNLSLITSSGAINGTGVITVPNLTLQSSGQTSLSGGNKINNIESIVTGAGLALVNSQDLSLNGTVQSVGNNVITVAGQLLNNTGSSAPFAGTTGSTTLRMLSPFAGGSLSLNPAGFSGFTPGYNGVNPGARNSIIYSVSPLTMFAPSGTIIAGVDLSGTQTGGGQLNTFLTGSDDLNWIVSDFQELSQPKVRSAGLEYTIYPKRVESETRTLPDSTLSQLRQELGRPPTIDEINRREVSMRESDRLRSGSILERSSLDSNEEPIENAKAATPSPIEGQIPQANQEPKKVVPTEDSSFELTPPMASSQVLPDGSFQPKADQRAAVSELLVKERANAEVGLAIPVARSK